MLPIPGYQLCMQSLGLQPTRLLCSWNFPGKNTWVGYHFLLLGICLTQGLNLCPLCFCIGRQILYHWAVAPANSGQPIIFTLSRMKCTVLFHVFKNVITSCKSSLFFLTPTCSINLICYFLGKIYLNQFSYKHYYPTVMSYNYHYNSPYHIKIKSLTAFLYCHCKRYFNSFYQCMPHSMYIEMIMKWLNNLETIQWMCFENDYIR